MSRGFTTSEVSFIIFFCYISLEVIKVNNKGFVVALSVALVAIVVAAIVFLAIYFMGERGAGTKPFDYAPREAGVYVQFDSGTNMDDIVRKFLPFISEKVPGFDGDAAILIGEITKRLPDLSFLKLAGFVVMPGIDEAEDYVAGIELSHRTNSKKSLDELLKSLAEIGFPSKAGEDGIIEVAPPDGGKGMYLKLDDDYLLLASLKDSLGKAFETRKNKDGLASLVNWKEIEGSLSDEFGFYLDYRIVSTYEPDVSENTGTQKSGALKKLEERFPNTKLTLDDWDKPEEGESIKIAGGLFSENGEAGLKAKIIGSAKEMLAVLPPGVKESFEDLVQGQKELEGELGQLDGKHFIEMAISGALTGNRKLPEDVLVRTAGFSKGTTLLWVDMDNQGASTFAIKSTGASQDVSSFVTANFPSNQYQSKKVGDHFEVRETMMGEDGKLSVADKATTFYSVKNSGALQTIFISNSLEGLNGIMSGKPMKDDKTEEALPSKPSIIMGAIGLDKIIQAVAGTSPGFEKIQESLPVGSLRIKFVLFEESDRLNLKVFFAMPF